MTSILLPKLPPRFSRFLRDGGNSTSLTSVSSAALPSARTVPSHGTWFPFYGSTPDLRGWPILCTHDSESGCPTLPGLFAGGWAAASDGIVRFDRLRAVDGHSISTRPCVSVAPWGKLLHLQSSGRWTCPQRSVPPCLRTRRGDKGGATFIP